MSLAILPPLLALVWYLWPRMPRVDMGIDDPYEIIVDDYAPDTLPPKRR